MSPTFTTLPWEIRNEIYSYVFDKKEISIVTYKQITRKFWLVNPLPKRTEDFHGVSDPQNYLALLLAKRTELFHGASDPQKTLALLLVNHQISDEAAAYFYHKMLFRGTWAALRPFIKGIGAYRRDMIKSVEITRTDSIISVFKHNEAFQLLSELPSLRNLRVAITGMEFFSLVTIPEKGLSPQGLSNFTTSVEIRVFDSETSRDREVIAQNVRRNGNFGLVVRAQLNGQENWFLPFFNPFDAKVVGRHQLYVDPGKTADHVTRRVAPRLYELFYRYEIPTLRPPGCEQASDLSEHAAPVSIVYRSVSHGRARWTQWTRPRLG